MVEGDAWSAGLFAWSGHPLKGDHRLLTFSLRTLFLALTALAVWLGIVVNRAREQREAVKAIEALGGAIEYERTAGPKWLRQLIGDEYLQEVWGVDWASSRMPPVTEANVKRAIPQLKRLRQLDAIVVPGTVSSATLEELKVALPGSNVEDFFGDSKIVYTERTMQHYQQ